VVSAVACILSCFLWLVSLFDLGPFLRPDLHGAEAGARRSCQGWPSHQPFHSRQPRQAIP
jgi:hypothetical protein